MIYGQDKDCSTSSYITFTFDFKTMVKVNAHTLSKGSLWDKYETVQANREYMAHNNKLINEEHQTERQTGRNHSV